MKLIFNIIFHYCLLVALNTFFFFMVLNEWIYFDEQMENICKATAVFQTFLSLVLNRGKGIIDYVLKIIE